MQIVYISNRPEIFSETLHHVKLFMPFIKTVVVCVPDQLESRFKTITAPYSIDVITESAILTNSELQSIPTLDHQRRNYLLRCRLVNSDKIHPQFIMSDDDARPLKPISIHNFVKEGKYRRYYFYDLAAWPSNQTEFDAGQIATFAVLNYESLEHLSYASHMPQIIDKALFLEASKFFEVHADHHPLCEWSSYFNYASNIHPNRFHKPETYTTLCWPEHPLAWKAYVKPKVYHFENHYPELYRSQAVFEKIDSSPSSHRNTARNNIEKTILWKNHTILSSHPEQSKSVLKYFKIRVWINKLLKHLF